MTTGNQTLLRRSLSANGLFSLTTGVLAVALSESLAALMGISEALLVVIGVGVVGFGLVTLWNARRTRIDLRLARLTVGADAVWVITATIVIFGLPGVMTTSGKLLLGVVSLMVGLFAVLQARGIRRIMGPKRLVTEVDIDASKEEVWTVLTDLDGYRDWNPFITEAKGHVAVGESLELLMGSEDERQVTMKPTVISVRPGQTFEWLGHVGVKGIFDGRHRFDVVPRDGGTRMVHSEEFTGVLVPALSAMLDGRTKAGFEAMNAAIKDRVESMQRQIR